LMIWISYVGLFHGLIIVVFLPIDLGCLLLDWSSMVLCVLGGIMFVEKFMVIKFSFSEG
jgi:hypothetical protein